MEIMLNHSKCLFQAVKAQLNLIWWRSTASLRKRLSEVKFLITHEISMASSDLWTDSDSNLGGIFMMIPKRAFAFHSVMTVDDFLQLPPV